MATVTIESTTLKNNILTQISTAVDSGGAAGHIKIYDSLAVLKATITLGYPAFASPSGGTMAFAAIAQQYPSGAGEVDGGTVEYYSSDSTLQLSGSVSTAGALLNLETTVLATDEYLNLSNGSISA